VSAIVIAEDDPDIRSMIAAKLSDEGHQVTATGDGVAALVAVRREKPDAVVLDMQMPGMSGLEVVRLLRIDPLTAEVPVIMVTAHSEPPYVGESFLSGADDFLAKPFSPRELAMRVEQMLTNGRHTSTRPPGEAAPPPAAVEAQPKPAAPDPLPKPAGTRARIDADDGAEHAKQAAEAVTAALLASEEADASVGRRRFFSLLGRREQ
jgi:DNA-binding response OmpR family regulator